MYSLWDICGEKEAVIYRLSGGEPVVKVPDTIEGYTVTAIGPYCFSDSKRTPENVRKTFETGKREEASLYMTELAGGFIEEIVLPDTLRQIGNAAFFNCRNLRRIELGSGELSVGSDVFNNCLSLTGISMRAHVSDATSLKQILGRISWNLEVNFFDAALFYPEYYESYETIAPAHIFGLNMEGEGFRARQCFRGDAVDLPAYDAIFPKACAEESVEVLSVMALNRLMSPIGLTERPKRFYEEYLRDNAEEISAVLVRKKDLDRLAFIWENKYIEKNSLDCALALSVQNEWSEGAAAIMEWAQKSSGICRKKRYDF